MKSRVFIDNQKARRSADSARSFGTCTARTRRVAGVLTLQALFLFAWSTRMALCQDDKHASGYEFFDAVNVENAIHGKTNLTLTDAWTILSAYNVTPDNIAHNRFLSRVDAFKPKKGAPVRGGSDQFLVVGAQSGAATGLSTTPIISDVAEFLVQRFKQELEIEGVDALEKALIKLDANPKFDQPITRLAPLTMAFVRTTQGTAAAASPNSWNTLADDFRKDLSNSASNINPFLDSLYPKDSPLTERRYIVHLAATSGVTIQRYARTPALIIDAVEAESDLLSQKTSFPAQLKGYDAGIKGLTLISHMLQISGTATPWATSRQIDALISPNGPGTIDAEAVNILLGLSFAKDRSMYDSIEKVLPAADSLDQITSNATRLSSFSQAVVKLAASFARIQVDSNGLPPSNIATLSDAQGLIRDLGSLSNDLVAAVDLFDPHIPAPAQVDLQALVDSLGSLAALVSDAKAANYTGIVGDLILIIPAALPNGDTDLQAFLTGPGQAIAAMAQAKNSKDFTAALDNYALPASWYLEKQLLDRSWTLNAYFGVTASGQLLSGGLSDTGVSKYNPRVGFTAPIGFAYNFGNQNYKLLWLLDVGATSVFVPVVDIGAVASWQLSRGNGSGTGSQQLSSFTFANVLAPGAYVVWTIKDTPLSIMLGTQYGPELTKVSTTSGNTIQRAAWQIPVLSFTFDLPILSLYQKAHAD